MHDTDPSEFEPLEKYYTRVSEVISSPKMLHYHTFPIQRDLIEAGAMAKVGSRLFFHKTRFWPEYQRIVANRIDGGQK